MKRSVVVGVDGSSESIIALEKAAELATSANSSLVVAHVRHRSAWIGMSPMTAGYEADILANAEAESRQASEKVLAHAPIDWEFVVRSGEPAHELMAVANERAALYIVVGGRPHGAAASVVLGSVASALVHHYQGSVLVARSNDDSEWIPSERVRRRWRNEHAIDAIYGEALSPS
jgi:nucleotide-binding universal stress UspA family protein